MKKIYLFGFVCLFLSSCVKDDYDINNSKLQYSPEIAAPLVKTSIVASDILSAVDSTMLSENGDKLLEFVYSDSIYSLSLSEIVDIPDENVNYKFQLEPLTIDDISEVTTSILLDTIVEREGAGFKTIFNTIDGTCSSLFPPFPNQNIGDINLSLATAPFQTATFSNGVLKIELENNWPTELTNIELSLKRVSDGVPIDTLRYASIPAGTSLSDSIDMTGKTIEADMVGEFLSLSSPGTLTPQCVNGSDSIVAKISGHDFVIVSGSAIFPNQEVVNDTVSVDVELGFGEELETLILNSGNMDLSIDYQIQEDAILIIQLPYATLNGDSFSDTIDVSAGPTIISESIDLSGYTFDLTRGGQGFNSIETVISANIKSSGLVVSFDTSNIVIADVNMTNIDPQFIDGYFGNQTISMDTDTQSFEIGAAEIFESMSFADPVVTLEFHNTFGLPIEISNLDLTMRNGGDEQLLNSGGLIPFAIQSGNISAPGDAVTSELTLGDQTNIAELINLWPNEVITGFTGVVNASGNTYNYANDASKLDVTLDLNIPLYGAIQGFNITDTIEIDSSMSSIFENVTRASLRTNVDNGFPLEAVVKFYITDENYLILDSLEAIDENDVLIAAGIVNVNGDVDTRGFRQSDLLADEDDIELLKIAGNKLLIKATLNTANSGADVKIYSNYTMDIKIGLLAKLSIEVDLNSSNKDEE